MNRLYEAIAEAAGIEGREVLAFVEDGYGREVALLARSRQFDAEMYERLKDARDLSLFGRAQGRTSGHKNLSFW